MGQTHDRVIFGVVLDCQSTRQPLSVKARLRGRCFAISFGSRPASKISNKEHFVEQKFDMFLTKIFKIYVFSKIFEKISLTFFGNLRFLCDFFAEKRGSEGVLFYHLAEKLVTTIWTVREKIDLLYSHENVIEYNHFKSIPAFQLAHGDMFRT